MNDRTGGGTHRDRPTPGAVHSAAPRMRIGILPLLPPAGQDAFGADKYWDYRKSQHRLVEELLRKYQGREADGLFIIPAYAMIDAVHGYPRSGPEPVNSRSSEGFIRGWAENEIQKTILSCLVNNATFGGKRIY